jgi:hypothetical protein
MPMSAGSYHSPAWRLTSWRRFLDGRQPKGLRLAEMLGNGPGSWEEQRRAFGFRQSA